MTLVDLDGQVNKKYVVTFHYSKKNRVPRLAERWPRTEEENMERLVDGGFIMDSYMVKCKRCNGKCSAGSA